MSDETTAMRSKREAKDAVGNLTMMIAVAVIFGHGEAVGLGYVFIGIAALAAISRVVIAYLDWRLEAAK